MSNLTVANTILSQIKAIDPRALFAWGVGMHPTNKIVGGENFLQFKTSGMVRWKGFVKVTLNGMDLYDIEFARVRGSKRIVDKVYSDVFVEDMVSVIDGVVG